MFLLFKENILCITLLALTTVLLINRGRCGTSLETAGLRCLVNLCGPGLTSLTSGPGGGRGGGGGGGGGRGLVPVVAEGY